MRGPFFFYGFVIPAGYAQAVVMRVKVPVYPLARSCARVRH